MSHFESWAYRGWRDTKFWWGDWRFLIADALSSAAVGLSAHPVLGLAWAVALLPIVAAAAFLRVPIMQRNEARRSLRQLLRDEASVRIETYPAEWEGAYLKIWNDGPSDEFEILVNPAGHEEMYWSPCHPRWGIEDQEIDILLPDENGLEARYELEPQPLRRSIHNGGYEYVSIALTGMWLHAQRNRRNRDERDTVDPNWDEGSRSIPPGGRVRVRFFTNELDRGYHNTTLADGEQLRFTIRVLRAQSQPIDVEVQLGTFVQTAFDGPRSPGISLEVIRQTLVNHHPLPGEAPDTHAAARTTEVPEPAA